MNWRSDSEEARANRTQLLLTVGFPYLGENQEICRLLRDLLDDEAKLRSSETVQPDTKTEWSRAKIFMDLRMKYLDATLRPPCLFDVLPKVFRKLNNTGTYKSFKTN